jgi:cell division protein FtsB
MDDRDSAQRQYLRIGFSVKGGQIMTLNPITVLSEQLQKLAIHRNHLALFKDQVVLLEKKAALLESENAELKAKVEQLTKDNEELRDKIKQYEQGSHNDLLKPKMKWGCLVFDGDDKLYCPSCFHKTGKKIETSIVNLPAHRAGLH